MSSTPGGMTLQSPLSSPGKLTRQQEKEQLSELNGRLAVFMDRVKTLRQSNDLLRKELDDAKAAAARELADARRMYEQEVADLRKVLDDTAREKAKNQITASKNEALANDLKAKLRTESDALAEAQRALRTAQQDLSKRDSDLKAALADSAAAKRAKKDMDKELAMAKEDADAARTQLEGETVARVDAENNLQSVREDMDFKQQLFDKERTDLYAKLSAKERDLDNTIAEFQARLDEQHTKELDDLREQFDHDLTAQREEIERAAEDKYRALADRGDRDRALIKSLMDENRKCRDDAQKMDNANTILDAKNGELQKRLDNSERDRNGERARHDQRRRELEDEISALRAENEGYRKAYEDLMDVQTRVDNEIQTYSALMDMEMPKGQRRGKRRRPADEQEESVSIVISEVGVNGDFVRISNTTSKDTSLGNWKLVRGPVTYKFGARFTLKGHNSVTVWSSGSGRTHRPPKDVVAKTFKSWPTNAEMICTLLSGDGQIQHVLDGVTPSKGAPDSATQVSTPPVRDDDYDVIDGSQTKDPSNEDLFHQQGDPKKGGEKTECVIC
ncbi:lamin-B2-like [Sycon ciliatum]|uniref:lamin-B2-like n=1 Tax=Sycon ciliatum TaxID=27933 RepID=UPI0020AE6FF6|eukprot:scpid43091/ scgid29711/ Lamin-A